MDFDVEAEFETLDRPCGEHGWVDAGGLAIDADICPDCIKDLVRRAIAATEQRVEEECGADKKRLDELQSMTTGYGEGWILRLSEYHRGWRLHETSRHGAEPDIRDAIDNGIHERRRQAIDDAMDAEEEAK